MWSSQKGFLAQVTDSLLSPPQPLLTQHWTLSFWEELLNNPWVLEKHDCKQRQPQTDNNSNQLVIRKFLSYWSEELGRTPCSSKGKWCWCAGNSTGGCWFPSPKLMRTGWMKTFLTEKIQTCQFARKVSIACFDFDGVKGNSRSCTL